MGFFNTSLFKKEEYALPRCGECGLYKSCKSPKMVPSGKGKRRILFVGEAPGETEDTKGVPFVGDAGQVLRDLLQPMKVDLEDCRVTNAAICRPPSNKIDDLYIESCRPNVAKTIREFEPNVIVLLGASAVQSVVGAEWKEAVGVLGTWVGWTIPSRKWNAWLCPTYHPSFLLRSGGDRTLKLLIKDHLKRALALEHTAIPTVTQDDLHKKVDVILDSKEARYRMEELIDAVGWMAFDFETTGLKPERPEHRIVSSSFCLNGERTFACEITPELKPVLSRVLSNPGTKKIASNLKFEERWSRVKLGHPVANWGWDTMLAAHTLDNRPGICSIKFQTYLAFGFVDYSSPVAGYLEAKDANGFNQIDKCPKSNLLLYNGMDSLVEYRVAERQREVLC